MMQSAVVVLCVVVLFLLSQEGRGGPPGLPLRQRAAFLKTRGVLALILLLSTFDVCIELGLTGLLPGFLRELREHDLLASNIGLVIFLGGIAAGRALLGLITGRLPLLAVAKWLFALAAVCCAVLFFIPLPAGWTIAALAMGGVGVCALLPLLITVTGRPYQLARQASLKR